MTISDYNNRDKETSSLALDLETLTASYRSLLIRYKQAVMDYQENLKEEANRPCAKYNADSKNIDQACYDEIWKKAGCKTTGVVTAGNWWSKEQTLNGLILDSWYWATMTDAVHRQGCYGTTEGNPYNLLGVGKNGRLYSCKGLGTYSVMGSDWTLVNDDLANDLGSVCTGNDGKLIVGSTTYGHVIFKDNWNDPKWKHLTNQPCCVMSVAMGQDGTLVGVGMDNRLYSKPGANGKPNLNGNWSLTASPGEIIKSICIAPDGSLFCIGSNDAIWKKNSYLNLASQNWQYMGNNTCCVKAITIASDGTFIGVGTDNRIYTKPTYKDLSTPWTGPYQNPWTGNAWSVEVVGITTITNPNYNGTGFSSAKSPNYNINAPILDSIKSQAFWGTGASSSDYNSGKTLQECSARCASTPNCSGATFNLNDHGRPVCFLRSGEGRPIPALFEDYAIIPKRKKLLQIVESINNDLTTINRKIQKKIDRFYSIYGNQIELRFSKNYSLIDNYKLLDGERTKINKVVADYQTLEKKENDLGLYATSNYYYYFIFFVIVFVGIITLYMSSIDQNTTTAISFGIVNPVVNTTKAIVNNVNPFYVMFGIILLVVVLHLYSQYFTSVYNNLPSLQKMGQLGIIYLVFVVAIIFVIFMYLNQNKGNLNMIFNR